MSPASPSAAATRLGLAATLLLPTAFFLGACSVIGGETCDGTKDELKRLAAQPLLDAAPARATAPSNYRGVAITTGCDDGSSGQPWLHADRLYAYPGTIEEVIKHYSEEAKAAGWQFEHDPSPDAAPVAVEGACWTRTEKDRHLLLNVDTRVEAYSPRPEADGGIAYEVSIGTTRDGNNDDNEATCWH
ncbi:hypothetical protein [Streptomyces sp. Ag109_O5-10]|uniref:hypothetical protein n=1 Tax=Streptomyces sp. Ag109_O5-10 TaxID=1855349 RepID=UPI0008962473|nr:hypothetical protein [Streptomyces sp. Ag109_O5-10]SEF17442.1 hypothetical protein SAMN05216533_8331 [Streptomyces sp. Ag109_O5-10]